MIAREPQHKASSHKEVIMVTPLPSTTEEITERLQEDPRTQDADIEVSFNQGVVTLMGTAKSEEIRQAAEEIARSQPAVITVFNELKVR